MELVTTFKLFTFLIGGGYIVGEGLGIYLKNKRENSKLANNKLMNFRESESIKGDDGLILTKNIQLKEKLNYEGVCVVGPNGSGKTTGVFFPNLLTNDIRGSIIVTDPKGELYDDTSLFQRDICKRKVYRLDLSNPDYSHKYNLLENCKNSQEVLQLASSILANGSLSVELQTGKKAGGVEWVQMAEPLLAATLFYCKELKPPYNTIEFAMQLIITLKSDQLGLLFEQNFNLDAITQFNIFKTVGGADRTEGSIKVTLATNMKIFTDRFINKICSKTTIDIESFRTVPSILYITYPERKSPYFAPFIAPFFSQVIDHLLDNFKNNKTLPITMMFDEFGNIGMLNNMSINAATVRSRDMSLLVCLQSISQLHQVYGRDNANNILNNLKTKLALPGLTDTISLEYFNKLAGDTEILKTSTSINSKGDKSNSEGAVKRRIFEDGELRTLDSDSVLIITDNKQPILDTKIKHYQEENYTKNIYDKPVKIDKDYVKVEDLNKELKRLKLELSSQEDIEDARNGLHFRES